MLSAGAAVAAPAAQAKALPGGIGIRLVADPISVASNPLARLYIIDHLAPGTHALRQVEVSNSTHETAEVAVYAAGAHLGRPGLTFSPGRVQDDLSSWTSVGRDVLTLRPGTDALETVVLSVPKDATPGEKYAVLWAQVSSGSLAHRGLLLVNRVGIRMYVTIGPGGSSPPDFSVGKLAAKRSATGEPLVTATVHNDGGEPLDIAGSVALSDGPGGVRGGPYRLTLGAALAPGQSEVATAVLSNGLPDGPWKAVISLASGLIARSATATLTFPLAGRVASGSV
jgi:hypothetical protein